MGFVNIDHQQIRCPNCHGALSSSYQHNKHQATFECSNCFAGVTVDMQSLRGANTAALVGMINDKLRRGRLVNNPNHSNHRHLSVSQGRINTWQVPHGTNTVQVNVSGAGGGSGLYGGALGGGGGGGSSYWNNATRQYWWEGYDIDRWWDDPDYGDGYPPDLEALDEWVATLWVSFQEQKEGTANSGLVVGDIIKARDQMIGRTNTSPDTLVLSPQVYQSLRKEMTDRRIDSPEEWLKRTIGVDIQVSNSVNVAELSNRNYTISWER